VDRGHFFFFNPARPWSAKLNNNGLLTNIKQKQIYCYSDSDLLLMKKHLLIFK